MGKRVLIASIATYLQPSGAVRVGLTLLDELLRNNYDVSFALLRSANFESLSRKFFNRTVPKVLPVYQLFPKPNMITTYHRLFLCFPLMRAIRSEDPDIVFIDHSSYKPLRRYLQGRKLIHYVHFPPFSPRLIKFFPDIYEESLTEEFKCFPFNIYWYVYMFLEKLVITDENFADVICTNSNFTAKVTKEIWGRDAVVIYPPVAVYDFKPLKKENAVASIGRIDPDKHFEDLIKAISMCKTKPKLKIVGGLTSTHTPYLRKIQHLVKKLNLNGRVSIKVNAPFDVVRETLGSSKAYVHTKRYEHFGITVVEAMASGCVPIVHRSGGPYLDVIDKEKYGFSFNTIEELAENIDLLIVSDMSNFAERCIRRSKDFSEDRFRKKIMHVIEK